MLVGRAKATGDGFLRPAARRLVRSLAGADGANRGQGCIRPGTGS